MDLRVVWLAGGFIGMFVGTSRGSALTCFSFLLLGGLIASNAKLSVPLMTALATMLGFFNGYLNGSDINRFDDGAYCLLGLTLALFVIVALFTSFVIPLRQQWALIVVRVAGSWIAASGLLMMGWALR